MKEGFMQEAIRLSQKNLENNFGWPFGAVIVKNWKIVGKWFNHVIENNDSTAHAEVMAIRNACENLNTNDLSGAEIYTSCEPCPMCLWAIYWARLEKIYYANTREDAAEIGFDDDYIYQEFAKSMDQRDLPIEQISHSEAKLVFDEWKNKNSEDKVHY